MSNITRILIVSLNAVCFDSFAGEHHRLWTRTLFPPVHPHFTPPPAARLLSNGLPSCFAFLSLTPSTAYLPLFALIPDFSFSFPRSSHSY